MNNKTDVNKYLADAAVTILQ